MRRRKTRIVCTMGPMEDERIPSTVQEFIQAGMDVARINMAHYDVSDKSQREYLHKLLVAIRRKAEECGEQVAIMGDIQGPKVRIRRFLGSLSGQSQVRLEKDEEFVLTMESDENIIDASDKGASVSYEGDFHFFNQISENVSDEENGEPGDIELWFADGKVIIKTSVSQIEPTHARCKVVVPGELKERQGITVKGSTIKPEHYNLADYPKDGADIVFLLREGVDLFALSFVNSAQDIMNMQAYIRGKVNELGLGLIRKRFLGMRDVPIIAKIETAEGVARLDEIMDACFGVMVARGDLALRTGIANIGILQKQIIDRCATKAKPVITATQMLLSMMDFREPRRPEVTDVTNAIFDGTDALMLSEETGDPSSLFPREAISTMARIAVKTEEEIRERNRIEYRNKITERHERAKDVLRENERKVDEARTLGTITRPEYEREKARLKKREISDLTSYNACEQSFELDCSAIVVLTETGGTARMLSRFKPDTCICAGVYDDQIARILKLSYGVEAIRIKRDDATYPFQEFAQVAAVLTTKGNCEKGSQVVEVAGFPRREPGTTTFLSVRTIE